MDDPKNTERKYLPIILNLTGLFFLMALSFWIGLATGKKQADTSQKFIPVSESIFSNKEDANSNIDFNLFWQTMNTLKEKYIDADKLDSNKILYESIKGMMKSTGDPYTVYFDPDENKQFGEEITGSFEGIGAELGIRQGVLTVVAPLQGSPAEKAGLRSGDKIIKIGDETTADMTMDLAVKKIRGQKGTDVVLTIWRNGDEETKEITVTRGIINVKSVEYEIKNDSIGYIKITRFAEDTSEGFIKAVNTLMSQNIKSYVIDLRNNPGGYLDAAVSMSNKMLPKDKVVLMEENGKGERKSITTRGGDVMSEYKTAVLINEGSASASEILAAALRENRDNVTLIGKKSYGKGSVQEFIDMPQGTAVKITVARWLTPKGNQINEVGISPDIEVDLTNEDYDNERDPQLDKALEVFSK